MRIRLWMIVLGVGLACAVAMWMKNQRQGSVAGGGAASESEHLEGAAAIRRNVTEETGGYEGAAAIRRDPAAAVTDADMFDGAAAVRDEPAE